MLIMKQISSKRWPYRKTTLALLLSASLASSVFFPSTAYAYVDPGSGSVIVTTILGLIAAIGYTCRKYFYKFKRMITGKKSREEQSDHEAS